MDESLREQLEHYLQELPTAWDAGDPLRAGLASLLTSAATRACSTCSTNVTLKRADQMSTKGEIARELAELERYIGPGTIEKAVQAIAAGGQRTKFWTPGLALDLLRKSKAELPAAPVRSGQWADLAACVASKRSNSLSRALLAHSIALKANALRAVQADRLTELGPWFATMRIVGRQSGALPPQISADLDLIEGTYQRDLRNFPEAIRLVRRAVAQLLAVGGTRDVALAVLSLAHTHFYAGSVQRAVAMAEFVLSLETDNPTRFITLVNLTVYQELLGLIDAARLSLNDAHLLSGRPTGPQIDRRLRWLEACLDLRASSGSDGFGALWLIVDEWIEEDRPYDAASVLVDISRLALARQTSSELARVQKAAARLMPKAPELGDELRRAVARLSESAYGEELLREVFVSLLHRLALTAREYARR